MLTDFPNALIAEHTTGRHAIDDAADNGLCHKTEAGFILGTSGGESFPSKNSKFPPPLKICRA